MLSRAETRCAFSAAAKVAALRRHPLFSSLESTAQERDLSKTGRIDDTVPVPAPSRPKRRRPSGEAVRRHSR